MLLYFSPNECPGLCWHRLGHLFGKINKVARNEKKKLWVFCIPKIWKILKRFTGTFLRHKLINNLPDLFLSWRQWFQDYHIPKPNSQNNLVLYQVAWLLETTANSILVHLACIRLADREDKPIIEIPNISWICIFLFQFCF